MDLPSDVRALHAELARMAAENLHLRTVLDHVPVGILIKDREGRFLYMNTGGSLGYGLAREQLIGKLERDVVGPDNDIEAYLADDVRVIDSGQPNVMPNVPFIDHAGTRQELHITKFPTRFEGKPAVLIVVYDRSQATRLALLERKVYEAQRLESLGLMAGGIAHDFNNLLVGVLANAELALRKLDSPEQVAQHIERLRGAALRLAELSGQMLAYSGRGTFTTERIDLSSLVDEMLKLVEASIARQVSVRAQLAGDLPATECDPAQIRQVVLNLITNAAEAIGAKSGVVEVRTEFVTFNPMLYTTLTLGAALAAGPYVCLTVSDDGDGMDAHTRQRLFDPFFTTKSGGRGLGLAAVLGIVRSHRGALQVLSQPGIGSTFKIWLPALPLERGHTGEHPLPAAARARTERVLVVDDEAIVRDATAALLQASGFQVATANDGAQALAAVNSGPAFDAVVLDMNMPGLTARQTHGGLRAARPDLPIVLTSGFSELDVVEELLKQRATVFIQKPYATDDLVAVIEGLLLRA